VIVQTVTAPGSVEPSEEAEITTQIVGRVVAVNVKDGDHVKKGQLLVKLDETDTRARLDSAKARIDRSKATVDQYTAELEKVSRDMNRLRYLQDHKAATPTEVADSISMVAKAKASLEMGINDRIEAEAMKRSAQQDLDRTEIKSPIDGVVAGVKVEVGEVAIAGTTNLPGAMMMTVGDLTKLRVRAEVEETDVPLVRPGQPTRIYLQSDPSTPIPCVVDNVAPKGHKTEEVVSFETILKVENGPGNLRPGMSATAEIEVRRAEDALAVPVQAVIHRRRKSLPDTPAVRAWAKRHGQSSNESAHEADTQYVKIVFVLEDGVAHARPIETGLSDERQIEVLSGIGADDAIIVGPFRALEELKDGAAVTLEGSENAEEIGRP
jgi:HlyD family secretion protein